MTGSDGQGAGYVYAFDRKTGVLRWKTPLGGQDTDLVRSGGLAIGGTTSGDLVALDLASGKEAWRFAPAERPYARWHSRSPALSDDRVFFAGPDGKVRALEAASGKVLWERDLGANVTTALLVTGAGLYAGSADRRLSRLDPATGTVTAWIELEAEPYYYLSAAEGTILSLLGESILAAFDPHLKAVRWKRTAPVEWTTPRPLVAGDTVLVGGPGELSALRLSDGSLAWSLKVQGSPRGLSLAGPVLYLGTLKGALSAHETPGRP